MTAKLSGAAAASRRWLETTVTPPPEPEPEEEEEPVDPEEQALLERFAELERRAKKGS